MNHPMDRLQRQLGKGEAFWIESAAARRYVTGFPSSAGLVLITKEERIFFVDFRYYEKACRTVTSCQVVLLTSYKEDVLPKIRHNGITTLFVEVDQVSISEWERLSQLFEGVTVSQSDRLTELLQQMRSVKTPQELASIRQAQALTDQTFSYILEKIHHCLT